MLHALRRANPQQSNDQGETESISYQAWRVFVTIWNFLLLAGWMKNPTEETSSLRRHAKESFREWLCLILVCIAALKKFTPNQINISFYASIPAQMRRFNPSRDAQKVYFSLSACLLCLSKSASDQQNKRKFSRTFVVMTRVR